MNVGPQGSPGAPTAGIRLMTRGYTGFSAVLAGDASSPLETTNSTMEAS